MFIYVGKEASSVEKYEKPIMEIDSMEDDSILTSGASSPVPEASSCDYK